MGALICGGAVFIYGGADASADCRVQRGPCQLCGQQMFKAGWPQAIGRQWGIWLALATVITLLQVLVLCGPYRNEIRRCGLHNFSSIRTQAPTGFCS